MKKIIVLSIVFTMFAGVSFAQTVDSNAAGFLDIATTKNAASAAIDDIGVSPKVKAYYVTDGTSTVTAQWYGISTVHPGGNEAYGTAQDLNNIYKSPYTTGSNTDTELHAIPTAAASVSTWTTWAATN